MCSPWSAEDSLAHRAGEEGQACPCSSSAPAGPAGHGWVPSSSWARRGTNQAHLAVRGPSCFHFSYI